LPQYSLRLVPEAPQLVSATLLSMSTVALLGDE
jgi:hypothetical protein